MFSVEFLFILFIYFFFWVVVKSFLSCADFGPEAASAFSPRGLAMTCDRYFDRCVNVFARNRII